MTTNNKKQRKHMSVEAVASRMSLEDCNKIILDNLILFPDGTMELSLKDKQDSIVACCKTQKITGKRLSILIYS